jgi:beta-lactamase regulating signal transducer with metallopeptidase domain
MKRALLVGVSLLFLASPVFVFAQSNPAVGGVSNPVNGASSNSVQNPLGGINSFCGLIKAILSAVIAIGIPIAVLFIVYAGFKFVLAMGNPGKLAEARQNLMYTLIGIGIFLGAWLLALVIANTVNSLGAGSSQSQIISCQ